MSKSEAAVDKIFATIADESDPTIATMDGICALCEKLDLDPFEDVRVLVLLWKLGSKEKPAQITKEEFTTGCTLLQIDSMAKLKALIPSLDLGFMDQAEFKDFYKVRAYACVQVCVYGINSLVFLQLMVRFFWQFCFQFNRQGTYRTLDKEMVQALLAMTLKGRIPEDRLDTFCAFLEKQEAYSR